MFTVILFGITGMVLGFFSLGFLEVVFYTTKAMAFVDGWDLIWFVAWFAASFTLIPVASALWQRVRPVWLLVIWASVTLITGCLVSVVTALVHHRTLNIPDWLIPAGLMFIPLISGVVTLLCAKYCWSRDGAGRTIHTASDPANGGPATSVGNSGVTKAPPSVVRAASLDVTSNEILYEPPTN